MFTRLKSSRIISALLILFFIIAFTIKGYSDKGKNPGITPALKSLLFPGLGQLHNGQKNKGITFMIIGASLIGTTAYMAYSTMPWWDEHNKTRTDSSYDNYVNRCYTANIFIGLTSAFWLYNVYDAYSTAKKSKPIKYGLDKGVDKFIPVSDKKDKAILELERSAPELDKLIQKTNEIAPELDETIPELDEAVETVKCPKCGADVEKGKKFCEECGASMQAEATLETIKCPKCGADIKKGKKFCGDCGAKIKK